MNKGNLNVSIFRQNNISTSHHPSQISSKVGQLNEIVERSDLKLFLTKTYF